MTTSWLVISFGYAIELLIPLLDEWIAASAYKIVWNKTKRPTIIVSHWDILGSAFPLSLTKPQNQDQEHHSLFPNQPCIYLPSSPCSGLSFDASSKWLSVPHQHWGLTRSLRVTRAVRLNIQALFVVLMRLRPMEALKWGGFFSRGLSAGTAFHGLKLWNYELPRR